MAANAQALEISPDQRAELESMARPQMLPHRLVRQARAVLLAADGVANEEIARRSEASTKTVRRWRTRLAAEGIASVGRIRPGRGRPPEIPDETIEAIVQNTLHTLPEDGSMRWSTRTRGDRFGVGKDTVARIWRARNIKPWLVDTFKLSSDLHLEERLVDVVGLCHDPTEYAVVLCADEKSRSKPSNAPNRRCR